MLTGVIFCDSDNLIARGIKDVSGDVDSHVALLFGNLVLHFRFLGFESMHISEFTSIYKVHTLLTAPRAIMVSPEAVIEKYKGGAYDFLGVIYLAIFILVRDFLGINLPLGNRLQRRRDRFCVEFCSEVAMGVSGSMWTPAEFRHKLQSQGWFESGGGL